MHGNGRGGGFRSPSILREMDPPSSIRGGKQDGIGSSWMRGRSPSSSTKKMSNRRDANGSKALEESNYEAEEEFLRDSDREVADLDSQELHVYLYKKLQQTSPGTRVTRKSLAMMEKLLDTVVRNIVTEAYQLARENGSALSTTEVLKATRKVLPGGPGKPLRPYLPGLCKRARHMDKESLKRKNHGTKSGPEKNQD